MKGVYAAVFGADGVRTQASLMMIGLALVSLVGFFFI